jgi:hypothetical protein
MTRVRLLALTLIVVASAAAAFEIQDAAKKKDPNTVEILPALEIPVVTGARLSSGGTYDNQPAVAETADGTTWVASVRYHNGKADDVVVLSRHGEKMSEAHTITLAPGQYIRPAIAAAGNDVWCVWTTSQPEKLSSIWYSRRTGDTWTPAARLLSENAAAHQNPEIAAATDGRVAVVYQIHNGKAYDIAFRVWDGKVWSEPKVLSEPGVDNWDPAVAIDTKGAIHAVWCGFKDGDYDIYHSKNSGAPRRISTRGEYDMHPWIAAAPDGTVWTCWDVIRIPNHANSGRTTITGANLKRDMDESHGKQGAKSAIDVCVIDGETLRRPGIPKEELTPPKGYLLSHCGMPKIAIASGGEPWIFYRLLRRQANSPGIGYFWEVVARPFRAGKWGELVKFSDGDGYLEEPAVAPCADGLRVAYGGEHRNAHIPKGPNNPAGAKKPADAAPEPPHEDPPGTPPHDHHHDFDSRKGWNGEIHLATIGDAKAAGPSVLAEAKASDDRNVANRVRMEPFSASLNGRTYKLLFGDLHRHSNVSRCSQGGEPTPDDLYRYGTDICRYDFFGLSDHAEDPRKTGYDVIDYYWWKQQKLADLYHVPGFMSVLYNLEWSLRFPHGHHNTIFPSRPTLRLDASLAQSSTLAAGWKLLEKNNLKAITIPHTGADPGMGTAWEIQDDRFQRVCEIFQACRGSYEHSGCPREFSNTKNKKGFYWNALEKGYHLGVICSSDHGYGVAYACVYAPENSRDSIWQAIWDRRTYGSTTYGLVLEMHSGTHWMGEEWSSKEAPVLDVFVRGTQPIRSVEILGRSKVLHAEGSQKEPLNAKEHRIRWSDPEWAAQDQEQWYYVRVIQADDEMAWSSPVWVKPMR